MSASAIALNRFGLGARPDEPSPPDPQRWLLSQFDAYEPLPAPWKPLPRTRRPSWRPGSRSSALRGRRPKDSAAASARPTFARGAMRTWRLSAPAPTAPSRPRPPSSSGWCTSGPTTSRSRSTSCWWSGLAGGFEADAIRPNVLGRFEDLLLAVVRHPAMLLYLDQAQSIGPAASPACARGERQQRARGLNENLAREILELHTLGVRSGYTQDDVTEFARALTGWTLPGDDWPLQPAANTFRFVPALHEPGARTVLGRSYADGGEQQARAIIHDLVTVAGDRAPHRPQAGAPLRRRRSAARAGATPGEHLRAHRRRPAERLPRAGRVAGGVAAGERQVQVALGLGDLEPARPGPAARCPRSRRRT